MRVVPACLCACRPKRIRQPDGSEVLVGCTEGCLNRLSFIHCDPRTCPCGTACTNKPFHLLKAPPLEVFLTDNRGHGVRLTQPLEKGQFVVEYAGEVCRAKRQPLQTQCGHLHLLLQHLLNLNEACYCSGVGEGRHLLLVHAEAGLCERLAYRCVSRVVQL